MSPQFKTFEGHSAWRSEKFADTSWIEELTRELKGELAAVARSLPGKESQWLSMTPADLDLPTLGPLLDAVSSELDTGRGFAVLRGIDLPPADVDYAYRVNWILAVGLGDVIAQNANGLAVVPPPRTFPQSALCGCAGRRPVTGSRADECAQLLEYTPAASAPAAGIDVISRHHSWGRFAGGYVCLAAWSSGEQFETACDWPEPRWVV